MQHASAPARSSRAPLLLTAAALLACGTDVADRDAGPRPDVGVRADAGVGGSALVLGLGQPVSLESAVGHLAVADFDGDGRDDLAVGGGNGTASLEAMFLLSRPGSWVVGHDLGPGGATRS